MRNSNAFRRVILFGAILVIIASVFLIVKNINEKEEGKNIGRNNGTTTSVDTLATKGRIPSGI